MGKFIRRLRAGVFIRNIGSAKRCVIIVALGAGACFTDKGASPSDATSDASGDDKTTTNGVPTTGGSGSGTTGDTSSGSTGDPTGDPTFGSTTGETPGDPAIELRCQSWIEVGTSWHDDICVCFVAAGDYRDQETCVAAIGASERYFDCLCSIYAKYPESNAFLDCVIPAQEQYGSCVTSAGCDQAKLDGCALVEGCMQAPPAVVDEVAVKCAAELP